MLIAHSGREGFRIQIRVVQFRSPTRQPHWHTQQPGIKLLSILGWALHMLPCPPAHPQLSPLLGPPAPVIIQPDFPSLLDVRNALVCAVVAGTSSSAPSLSPIINPQLPPDPATIISLIQP
uniref:Uncharacterized protein n=1 Tax=Setaria italica TaxID=4555 RepID=K3ZAU0_SETIT